jgi:hypothetical protein
MRIVLNFLILSFVIISCTKDKAASTFEENHAKIDGRTEMIGQYKVYNESQNFLYDMEISLVNGADTCTTGFCDGIMLHNLADKFDLWCYHSKLEHDSLVHIAAHQPIEDPLGYSWHLSRLSNGTGEFNTFHNDTIKLYFTLSNIAYYLTEGTSYFNCSCIHIAVKQ